MGQRRGRARDRDLLPVRRSIVLHALVSFSAGTGWRGERAGVLHIAPQSFVPLH